MSFFGKKSQVKLDQASAIRARQAHIKLAIDAATKGAKNKAEAECKQKMDTAKQAADDAEKVAHTRGLQWGKRVAREEANKEFTQIMSENEKRMEEAKKSCKKKIQILEMEKTVLIEGVKKLKKNLRLEIESQKINESEKITRKNQLSIQAKTIKGMEEQIKRISNELASESERADDCNRQLEASKQIGDAIGGKKRRKSRKKRRKTRRKRKRTKRRKSRKKRRTKRRKRRRSRRN